MHTSGPTPYTAPAADGSGGFVGRRSELAQLRADIGRAGLDTLSGRPAPRGRVLLVAGRPGSGRTALAEEFARQVAADYPAGVLRARLTDPDGTPVPTERTARDLLRALGRPVRAGAGEEELTEALRAALSGRRALLLLDEVAGSGQLADLVPESRDCLVLAVSRGPLTGVPDVRPCTLGGLDTASAVALLARCAGETPRVTVDPRAAERLVEACGGRPAALVLVGGWLAAHPMASVAEAVRRFGDLPDTLPGEAADGTAPGARLVPAPRPRPAPAARPLVRALLLVHGSLPPAAARTLRLLALAPAGLADAHTVAGLAGCPVDAAAATLEGFVRLGLLRTTAVPGQYEVPGCLAPLLAVLLRELERPADVQLARARMLERTVRLLRSCRAAAEPPGSRARREAAGLPRALRFATPAAAAAWLDSRLPALRAAAGLAARDGELDTLARRLVSALTRALSAHLEPGGAAPELYRLYELLPPVAARRGLHGEHAAALLALGDLDLRAGRPREALTRYRAALEAAREAVADPAGAAARALESLGDTYSALGDRPRATDWYGRALALCQTRGDLAAEARLHGRIGAEHLHEGDWEEALRAWRAAAAACRRLKDRRGYVRALEEAARVQELAGRAEEALRTRREALRWARRLEGGPLDGPSGGTGYGEGHGHGAGRRAPS
ncbi:tetratricopeptide repeat protein [Streptomyces glaucosporus]|uniref:Tetratricopeptide repeat protein n=1 Tax=Streptomyces glaucosporus TaxID=284044 RepID=A0ABN3J1G9_9ACTN